MTAELFAVESDDLGADDARELVCEVTNWLDDYPVNAVLGLYAGRAWIALGYPDWESLCAAEFGGRVRMARPERQEVVAFLRREGMSTRAIATAVGVSHPTVLNDMDAAGGKSLPPAAVIGEDGKSYPAARPPRVEDDTPRPTPPTPPPPPPPSYSPPTDVAAALAAHEPVVVNMRDQQLRDWLSTNGHLARIDRATKWGNPFILDDDGDRDAVITNYRDHYLPNKPSLLHDLDELTGKALGCWCAPEPCHGDILVEAWWTR